MSGKSPSCPIKFNIPIMMGDSDSNAWSGYFPQETVSPTSEEDFMHSKVLPVECALETENIHQLGWSVASYPALVMSDSQDRTSAPFIFCSQLF